jgi:photosystem II protein
MAAVAAKPNWLSVSASGSRHWQLNPLPSRSLNIGLCRLTMGAAIQFFRGVDEPVVPDIRLTRSRDGRTGQALFVFEQPDALAPETMGDITGMFMVDEEGSLVTREVKARFVNGKASALEATYTWKNTEDFERFMRFAQRYADSHDLGFSGREEGGEEA